MDCLLIGTGGMMPLPERHLNSLMVRLEGVGYQFDCGEGTQVAMKKWRTGFRHIRLLAISHLHGDHVLGLPGVLMCRTHAETTEPLIILGPVGIRRFVENTITDLRYHVGFPLEFIEVEVNNLADEKTLVELYADDRCTIFGLPLVHGTPCLGYRLEEKARPGKFSPEQAKKAGVVEGPLWGQLQRGQEVSVGDKVIQPDQVLGPARRGRVCCLVTDTIACKNAYRLAKDADIAFLEGMFLEEDLEKVEDKAHMTVRKAASIGKKQGALKTVIVHLSPRYRPEDLPRMTEEARAENPTAEVGVDGRCYQVELPD